MIGIKFDLLIIQINYYLCSMPSWLKTDPFGNSYFLKGILLSVVGAFTFPRLHHINRLHVTGMENLDKLPQQNVLFVSNHQTYFADVMGIIHVFSGHKWGYKDHSRFPFYLISPKLNTYFVAAFETMKKGILPKLFARGGAILIKRTWRVAGEDVDRGLDRKGTEDILKGLSSGWVINFPQGTTTAYAPGRKGTAHIILKEKPIVVPIVIDRFRRAFDKTGLKLKKRGTRLSIRIKEPLEYTGEESIDEMLEKVMDAIEQSEKFKNPEFRKELVITRLESSL